jgi:N,N'-diacetyllegionaminate synthase
MINKNKVIFIAEAGVNHNGSISKALKLIDAAADAGADFIKFQHTNPSLISKTAGLTEDQSKRLNKKIKQKEFTKSFHLNWDLAYPKLIKRAKQKKINFLTSVFSSQDYLKIKKFKFKNIKIASGEIVNYPLLQSISGTKDTVFLSTGGSNLAEIKKAINILKKKKKKKIFLLHCVSAYPVPLKEINLKTISYLKKKTGLDIGYSDHGLGTNQILVSIGLGAKVIEKHFTLNKSLRGPDHKISLNPKELKEIIQSVRQAELILGKNNKKIQKSEKKNLIFIRQSMHANQIINKGEKITIKNTTLMRPYDGICSMEFYNLLNNRFYAKKKYITDDPIKKSDFQKNK